MVDLAAKPQRLMQRVHGTICATSPDDRLLPKFLCLIKCPPGNVGASYKDLKGFWAKLAVWPLSLSRTRLVMIYSLPGSRNITSHFHLTTHTRSTWSCLRLDKRQRA